MLHDLDETLRQLLIREGELDPTQVAFTFESPAHQATGPGANPSVNLYLYDLVENPELREMAWDVQRDGNRRVRITPRPLRMTASYLITCAAANADEEHRLLWRVLETLARNTVVPPPLIGGALGQLLHPLVLGVAQPDAARNGADFWNGFHIERRPALVLTATLDLDLNQVVNEPLVLTRELHLLETEPSAQRAGSGMQTNEKKQGLETKL